MGVRLNKSRIAGSHDRHRALNDRCLEACGAVPVKAEFSVIGMLNFPALKAPLDADGDGCTLNFDKRCHSEMSAPTCQD